MCHSTKLNKAQKLPQNYLKMVINGRYFLTIIIEHTVVSLKRKECFSLVLKEVDISLDFPSVLQIQMDTLQ